MWALLSGGWAEMWTCELLVRSERTEFSLCHVLSIKYTGNALMATFSSVPTTDYQQPPTHDHGEIPSYHQLPRTSPWVRAASRPWRQSKQWHDSGEVCKAAADGQGLLQAPALQKNFRLPRRQRLGQEEKTAERTRRQPTPQGPGVHLRDAETHGGWRRHPRPPPQAQVASRRLQLREPQSQQHGERQVRPPQDPEDQHLVSRRTFRWWRSPEQTRVWCAVSASPEPSRSRLKDS